MVKVAVGSGGFEPPKLAQLIYSQSHLATLVTAPMLSTPVLLSDQRPHYSRPFMACQAFFDQIFVRQKTHTSPDHKIVLSTVISLPGRESHRQKHCVLPKLL